MGGFFFVKKLHKIIKPEILRLKARFVILSKILLHFVEFYTQLWTIGLENVFGRLSQAIVKLRKIIFTNSQK